MTRALLATAMTALALLSPGAAHAAAGPADPVNNCGFSTITHPFTDERQMGYLGDAVVAINDGADPRTGRVTCTLRQGFTHDGPVLASVTSLTTPGVVAVPATVVEFVLEPDEWFTVCLSVEVDGAGTFYWDDIEEAWSASPLVTCYDWTPDDDELDVIEEHVDPVVCAVLAGTPSAGPVRIEEDGDLYVADTFVWDCPPYEWATS
ncbi:MAG TPA: hypothetical protein VNQ77_14025 [Frankiaceae bacterium]|nr:hypothetical protein [Frankiaceae bacterium]